MVNNTQPFGGNLRSGLRSSLYSRKENPIIDILLFFKLKQRPCAFVWLNIYRTCTLLTGMLAATPNTALLPRIANLNDELIYVTYSIL